VLAVGGSTVGDGRYSWSNFGSSWVDIAAPGCNLAQQLNGVVGQFCGTSAATPFTAGVAALLASTTPQPSAATIRTALTSSAAPLAGHWVAASSGRVDAAAALRALPFGISSRSVDRVPPTVAVTRAPANGTRHIRRTAYVDVRASDHNGVRLLELVVNGKVTQRYAGRAHRFSVQTWKHGRSMTVRVRASDRSGNLRYTPARIWYR
jgi:thermitase